MTGTATSPGSLPATAHYGQVDGTTWPVNVGDIEYALRYGDPASVRLLAASVVSAYAHLLDTGITDKMAVASLRRARKAEASRA